MLPISFSPEFVPLTAVEIRKDDKEKRGHDTNLDYYGHNFFPICWCELAIHSAA